MLTCILATVDVFLPTEVAQTAGRDAWIAALLAPFIGYIIYRIIVALCLLFPDLSLAGINQKLLGKYLGGLVTIFYILSFLLFCTLVAKQFSIIISTSFKPESPPYVWHLVILIPALSAAFLGIAVPARMNEILLPLGILLLVVVGLLNIPNIDLSEYLPMLQHGYLPPIEGAVMAGSRLTYGMFFLALIPLLSKKEKLPGQGVLAFVIVCLSLLIGTLSIAILGLKATEASILPALMIIRSIDIGFLTRMDAFMMTIWHTGFFIFLSVFVYSAASLTRDLFKLKDYRLILLLYGVVIMGGANFYITNVPIIRQLLMIPIGSLLYFLSLVLPLFLYGLARVKGYRKVPVAGQE